MQQLLAENNISRSGRKPELIERVLILIRQNISVLRHKVRELHRKAQQEAQELAAASAKVSAVGIVDQTQLSGAVLQTAQNNALAVQTLLASGAAHLNATNSGALGNNNIHGIANNRAVGMYQQQYNNAVQNDNRVSVNPVHANGLEVPQYNFPVHNDVQLKKLAFYDELGILVKPSTLMPNNNAQRTQETSLYFHLTPQQANEIALNRDCRNPAKIEHIVQVQLRFCLLETSCEQEDYFPPNIVVKVNNKLCTLPNPIPTNKPGVDPKRPPRPVNITPLVKISPLFSNHILVSWNTEYNRCYAAACFLVRKLCSVTLLQRMKTKGVKSADYTRALIKEKLNEDADCEIATTMLKVSLICPLGKMRMTTPCRSSTCSHLQCFDASLYLQMNERKPTWNCPVCDKPAVYDNLVIDGYFQEVLASTKLSSEDTEIQLHKDGSWSTHVKQNESLDDSVGKVVQKVEVISDDIEVITTDPPKHSIMAQTSVISTNEPSSTSGETVDLTLSDSDDDAPSKRKVANSRSNSSSNNPTSSSATTASTSNSSTGNGSVSRSKLNEDPSSSVISLDSPSPPSTPNPSQNGSNNDVSSTTTPSLAFNALNQQQQSTLSADQLSFQYNSLPLQR